MAVYYKFKSAKAFDSIPIEGQFISVANLKERIFETKLYGKGNDFDLMISNAQSNEEYIDEGAMIPKNTSVLIRRVPGRPRKSIVTERVELNVVESKIEELPPPASLLVGDSSINKYIGVLQPEEYEWDEFGNDLYAIPETNHSQTSNFVVNVPPGNKVDEESKIKALIDTPALDWNHQTQDAYGAGRGYGRGRGMGGRGFGRGMLERRTPPAGYVCHRCKVPGHFIQHCPTNGDPNYDIKRAKPPTGIPKSMLMATSDGSYALPSGAVAVLKPNEAAFEKEIEGLPTTRPVCDLPPQLHCPLCKEVMKDAVLTSKCCFTSFCDKCIRDYIMSKLMCFCGATDILADDLLPNKTFREAISRIMESTTASTENAGSIGQVPGTELAHPVHPKASSYTLSAASKDMPKHSATNQSDNMINGEVASEIKTGNSELNPADKQAAVNVNVNVSEAAPESLSKGPRSPECASVVRDIVQEKQIAGEQGKKKKKKKPGIPITAADMQCQDFGTGNFGMSLAASGYNPYWAGGMPLGVDPSYMAPYGGPMPFMGYAPGPFEVPFTGGMFPQDPFAAQPFMMPPVPRNISELGMTSMVGMGQRPPPGMRREETDTRKADTRHKREMDQISGRPSPSARRRDMEHPRNKELSSSVNHVSSIKPKPKPMGVPERDRFEKSSYADRYGPVREREPTPRKRKFSDHDEEPSAAEAERKQKSSVFSRIRLSNGGEKRNGMKEQPASHKVEGGGRARRGSRGCDGVSSEDDYHLKRRPAASSSSSRGRDDEEHRHRRPASKRRGEK
ncbi:E3 ubiquitin ligase PQT3-like isoform X1 [Zingiber officinale]|uniref:E3 ubiquitin ligase PQT3-like isoform X1 n=1 Tax=Zingiber officinale TaxID=94328 RepID=UPI001C4ABAE8|nr:E3 ubiquitin ligase PQT3-like isoform X1 [Zingiber officinale]